MGDAVPGTRALQVALVSLAWAVWGGRRLAWAGGSRGQGAALFVCCSVGSAGINRVSLSLVRFPVPLKAAPARQGVVPASNRARWTRSHRAGARPRVTGRGTHLGHQACARPGPAPLWVGAEIGPREAPAPRVLSSLICGVDVLGAEFSRRFSLLPAGPGGAVPAPGSLQPHLLTFLVRVFPPNSPWAVPHIPPD